MHQLTKTTVVTLFNEWEYMYTLYRFIYFWCMDAVQMVLLLSSLLGLLPLFKELYQLQILILITSHSSLNALANDTIGVLVNVSMRYFTATAQT